VPRTRLTALDAVFLELEDADPTAHMHLGAILRFEGAPPPPDLVVARLADRLPALPRFAQRLSRPHSGALERPCWIDDETFDPADHVRRAALPRPGGEEELLAWAGEFFSHRLDRARPLWETVIVEGLAGDGWALATKAHHCLVDGVGSLQALALYFDGTEPAPASGTAESHGFSPFGLARAGAGVLRHPLRAAERAAALAELVAREEIAAAPRSSINVRMGKRRRLAVARAHLADVKAVERNCGATVNDVVLAAVAGGLRRLLEARGEEPPAAGLRAMVPVNVRPGEQAADLGNQISSLFVALPVDEPTAAGRLARVQAATAALKAGRQSEGARALLEVADRLPPALDGALSTSLFGTRLFNLTVTNVPGPPAELRAFGSPLREVMPLVPLAAEHAVGVAVFSYDGRLTFTVNADARAVPDAEEVALGIEADLAELAAPVPA
jgi:diacylglycerol O-acyltransferase / wax synthase